MRHHSGSDRRRRVAIALVIVSSLVAAFAGAQLIRGDSKDVPAASALADEAGSLGRDQPVFKDSDDSDDSSSDKPASGTSSTSKLLSTIDVYANPQGPARRLRVTLTLISDGPIYEAYDYRDGKRGGPAVVDKHLSITRTVRGPVPVARLGAQVMMNATYVTCRITVDGTVVAEDTAHGPGNVAGCVG